MNHKSIQTSLHKVRKKNEKLAHMFSVSCKKKTKTKERKKTSHVTSSSRVLIVYVSCSFRIVSERRDTHIQTHKKKHNHTKKLNIKIEQVFSKFET